MFLVYFVTYVPGCSLGHLRFETFLLAFLRLLFLVIFFFVVFFLVDFFLVLLFFRRGFSGRGTVSMARGLVPLLEVFFLRVGFSGVGHVPILTDDPRPGLLCFGSFFVLILPPYLSH